MVEDSSEEELQFNDLPRIWWHEIKVEWSRRTTLGKVFYPIWLTWSAMAWILAGFFLAFVLAAKQLGESSRKEREPPSWMYKDD